MIRASRRLRVATYNVHRCCGLDRRVRPERVARILRRLDADVIALQEVVSQGANPRRVDQARFIAGELGCAFVLGETRKYRGAAFGNVILSRFPVADAFNYDISIRGFERRGCLRVDLKLDGSDKIHIFNVHLGTAFLERRSQARKLLADDILGGKELEFPRIVLGDFNEWTRGLVSRLLAAKFQSVDLWHHLGRSRTYPGMLPLMHLDHIYFDPVLELRSLTLERSPTSLLASDHLPLVADFDLPPIRR